MWEPYSMQCPVLFYHLPDTHISHMRISSSIWDLPPVLYYSDRAIDCRSETLQISYMSQSTANNMVKKLIRIDVSSDTVCPWCCVGKKNLDNAIASSKIHYDFKVFLLLCFYCS